MHVRAMPGAPNPYNSNSERLSRLSSPHRRAQEFGASLRAMKTDHKIVLVQKKAEQSPCRNRIGALGFNRNGDCIMKAFNKYRFGRKGGGVHAEMQIMQQARKKGIVHILICRIGRGGDLLPIEPCRVCQEVANKLGIVISSVPGDKDV